MEYVISTMTKKEFEEHCFAVYPEYRKVVKLFRESYSDVGPHTMLREIALYCFEHQIENEHTVILRSVLKELDDGSAYFKAEP